MTKREIIKHPGAIFREIMEKQPQLRALPQTLVQTIKVVRDENSSAAALGSVVQSDPALCVKILCVANSPFFGQQREIKQISQAVQLIGARAVLAFALSLSIYKLTADLPGKLDRKRFWRHSLETAVAGRLLAESIAGVDPEEAFICALLHDIGKVALEGSRPEIYGRILAETEAGGHLRELEQDEWGVDHTAVGQFLLEQWNLPSEICEAVGNHHPDCNSLEKAKYSNLTLCVSLANTISRYRITERSGDSVQRFETKTKILEALGLLPEQVLIVEEKLPEEIIKLSSYLEIDVGDPLALALDANQALYDQFQVVEELLRQNKQMQKQIANEKARKKALESLKAIAGTYNHYLNNATATILGQSQLTQLRLERGDLKDPSGVTTKSIEAILNSVETISATLKVLNEITALETKSYHDDLEILDIENLIEISKRKLKEIPSAAGPKARA
ncbi:MAG: HDOD domain-containing protein [candidate division Zixibacteria bacterium]|nr:HDOD domain-containing protein [candidate division Zixibacteria bacterium]